MRHQGNPSSHSSPLSNRLQGAGRLDSPSSSPSKRSPLKEGSLSPLERISPSSFHGRLSCHPHLNSSKSVGRLPNANSKHLEKFFRNEVFEIANKSNNLVIRLTLRDLMKKLKKKLEQVKISLRHDGIRLAGSAASYFVSIEEPTHSSPKENFNDVDFNLYLKGNPNSLSKEETGNILFNILLSTEMCLQEIIYEQTEKNISLKEVCSNFFQDTVKVDDEEETWSLISFGNGINTLDIKFILRSTRSYVFSVDSFEIVLNPLLSWWKNPDNESAMDANTPLYFESVYGDYKEALDHLRSGMLKTKNPEQVRKGLFRYCLELSKGRTPESNLEEEQLQTTFCDELFDQYSESLNIFQTALEKFVRKHPRQGQNFCVNLYVMISRSSHPHKMHYAFAVEKLCLKMMVPNQSVEWPLVNGTNP